jgi:hypothetical protein
MESATPLNVASAEKSRSTFVTVVAWIFIVISGFALLMSVMQNVMFFLVFPQDSVFPQDFADSVSGDEWAELPAVHRFMMTHLGLWFFGFFLVCAFTLLVSVGLLRRKNWARRGFIGLMGLGVAWNLLSLVLMYQTLQSESWSTASDPDFQLVQNIMFLFTVAFAFAMSGLFAWLAIRLRSPLVRADFVPLPIPMNPITHSD